MWKLHRKLNFPNIFRLAAIYTWAPAFKLYFELTCLEQQEIQSNVEIILYYFQAKDNGNQSI